MLQHLPCQLRFGGKACFLGNPGFPATGRIFRPAFGQVQTAIDQRGTFWGDITEKNTDLAVLNPSGRSAVLTLHACGLIPFLRKPVSSTTAIPSGWAKCSKTYCCKSSRTASASHRARPN